ncbi:MAG: hypothetical protein AW12_00264 [Candidatus Accumulibacter sp. BA-94]|jgi:hypothetical protein|uniref:hypothetical protein n=1 Tax=Accumulibacter sp. TaxID=2053492 RepID=UPI0004524A93|nr:hypothetical protein [Accumulibacter sp.]EXI92784.1 MAG: hypothetical protein AW12_00264 [Candidatus Accumulibacter sp. BA-94]HRD86646.1 hypothetical protein [Accumulibacter sp.]
MTTPSCDSNITQPTGKEAIYGDGGLPIRWLHSIRAASILALLAAAFVTPMFILNKCSDIYKGLFSSLWLLWVFGPPVWFSFEYFHLFKKHGKPGTFEAFKYGQELASRAWLGIAAVMSLIATDIYK